MFEVVNAYGHRMGVCASREAAEALAAKIDGGIVRELSMRAPGGTPDKVSVVGAQLTRSAHPLDGRFGEGV